MSENPSNEPFVLGRQYAEALNQEEARLKAGSPPPSALPRGEYEAQAGEFDLLNPTPSDLDIQIRKSCMIFSGLSQIDRAKFTAAISMDEFFKLIEFARRSAVFALRANDANLLQDALSALSIIEAKRTDFRDIVWVLALLHHTASQIGLEADCRQACGGTRTAVYSFLGRDGFKRVSECSSQFISNQETKRLFHAWCRI
jgi:hypothetical protein